MFLKFTLYLKTYADTGETLRLSMVILLIACVLSSACSFVIRYSDTDTDTDTSDSNTRHFQGHKLLNIQIVEIKLTFN